MEVRSLIALVFFVRRRWDGYTVLLESRTKPSHERAKFANVIALIQVNARISRFTAAMSRQMGSD